MPTLARLATESFEKYGLDEVYLYMLLMANVLSGLFFLNSIYHRNSTMLSFDRNQNSFFQDSKPIFFSEEEISEMNSLNWWHSIPFSPAVRPKGFCQPEEFISKLMLDRVDFSGKTVLDIGCWDGFQAFFAEAQGASKVVGVDDLSQRHAGALAREFAKRKLGSKVEFVNANVYDLSVKDIGSFDIVMMFGVLYHLIHPMLGLEKACGVCKEQFLISTHFVPSADSSPWCLLYPATELAGDNTNWSGPNIPWIVHGLNIQGFEVATNHIYDGDRICVHSKRVINPHVKNPKLNAHRETELFGLS